MIVVGVTGGIGSGKTTVCNMFQSYGAYVLNADDLAKSLMVEDPDIREEIIEVFGSESYLADGTLNRPYLAEEAFGKDRVDELNGIVHPRIPKAAQKVIEQAGQEGYELFVYEAALLLQNLKPSDNLDYIILVLADRERRVNRVVERDKVGEQPVLDRMGKQQDFSELTHLADFVIRNNGTLEELKNRVDEIYARIIER